jgi:hypothetical protein
MRKERHSIEERQQRIEKGDALRRVNTIINMIHEDPAVTRDKVEERMDRKSRRRAETDELGRDSVLNTIDVLISQKEIWRISETEPLSTQDVQGRDLKVFFDRDSVWVNRLPSVWVEVKSSDYNVDRFVQEHGLDYLNANSIVVINGQRSDEEILNDFWRQVQDVYQHIVDPRR